MQEWKVDRNEIYRNLKTGICVTHFFFHHRLYIFGSSIVEQASDQHSIHQANMHAEEFLFLVKWMQIKLSFKYFYSQWEYQILRSVYVCGSLKFNRIPYGR